ncbi:FHA domain-containing protein [Planctomycetota bacterium]
MTKATLRMMILGLLVSCTQGSDTLASSTGLASRTMTIQSQAGSSHTVARDRGLPLQSSMPKRKPNALTIVIDTSWSCEHEMSDFVSLGRHAVSSGLYPGDDLEIISAHVTRPMIRAAQTIKSGSSDEIKNITTTLKSIRNGFLSNASLFKAIEMAFNRLDKKWAQKQYGQVSVIVFSDGRATHNDAEQILDLSTEFRRKGWSLYLTGNKDTNRKLLVAANQGKFNWSLISEATPSVWLNRQKITYELDEKERVSSQKSQVIDVQKPITEEPKPLLEPQKEKKIEGFEHKTEISIDDTEAAPEKPQGRGESLSNLAEEIELAQPEELSDPSVTSPTDSKDGLSDVFWWILLPVVGLLAFLSLAFFKPMRKAMQWKLRVGSHLKKTLKPEAKILVAELNGQSYRLGRPDRIKAIHIGSGPENTIRVPDKSIQTRHVTIHAKKNNLMLRNVSKYPVTLNGNEIRPGGQHRLVFPSVVRLNDKVKLALRMIKQAVTQHPGRSVLNET